MNKTEMIAAMAETSGLSKKDCEAALTAFLTATESALKSGDKVEFRVLKSKIGSSALNDTLAAANDESEVLTDGGVALKL